MDNLTVIYNNENEIIKYDSQDNTYHNIQYLRNGQLVATLEIEIFQF